jgi:hypothetical protein
MNTFLLDLWHDLREKRLWPIAAVLALALVAVPVLLAKPAEEAAAPVVKTQAPKKLNRDQLAALAQVKLGDEESGKGSTLGVFDPSNPFKPPKGAIKKEKVASGNPAGPTSSAPTGGTGGGGLDLFPPTDQNGGTGGGGTGGGTGGTGGGGTTTTTTVYKYVVDITFTANGRTRRIKGLEKLDMLPSQSSPLLIFLGVTPKGSDAVFLVDSTLSAAGEGRCKPSEAECAFAYIGPGSEYMFTTENGDSYEVSVDEIRKVEITAGGASAKAGDAKGAKAHASVGEPRRFVSPLVADLVVVASESTEDSNTETESR